MIGLSDDRNVAPLVRHFRDLEVYKKAFAVSLAIHRRSLAFPQIEQYAIADQIRRASKSICANVAEGFAKQSSSKAEFKRFLKMAIGSSDEMAVWIDYCQELDYINREEAELWRSEYNSISRMLQTLHAKV